jgi:tRNA pseudouridine38-40 synthase
LQLPIQIVRYFIRLSFLGTRYSGWQIQDNAVSVQQDLNNALSVLLKHPVLTTGCGRTDAGVHARKFYAHFDTETLPAESTVLVHQLNGILTDDIAIQELIPLHESAHSRFDASSRTYEYRIYTVKNPFLNGYSTFLPYEPDLEFMNQLSSMLPEFSDFSCFSKSGSQTLSNRCKISSAGWLTSGEEKVFTITADRFLRNMVRAIVGTLLEAGRHKLSADEFRAILMSKDRREAGPSVPAQGLYLTDIRYPFL